MIKTVAVVDYGMGNLYSVARACEQVGLKPVLTHESKVIRACDGMILPGVGAFGDAIGHLRELGSVEEIKAFIQSGKPFLGVCLGMQLLLDESEEFGSHQGLGLVKGIVHRFPEGHVDGRLTKIPQVGWNQIKPVGADFSEGGLLAGLKDEYMYFVHSFYTAPEDGKVIAATAAYAGLEYCCAIQEGNISAVQFHPEKSAEAGLRVYRNWARMH